MTSRTEQILVMIALVVLADMVAFGITAGKSHPLHLIHSVFDDIEYGKYWHIQQLTET